MQSRFKQAALFSIKLLLSIAVLVYIARGLDLQRLRSHLVSVDPLLFVLALSLIFFQTFVLNGRWELIMRALGVSLDWLAGWRILMISLWFNQVLPSSVGGDAVRMWLLRQRGVQWPEAVKGVAADRFTALIGLIALMVAGLPFLLSRVSDHAAILAIGGLTLAGVAGTVILLTLDRLPKRLIAHRAIASFVRFGALVRFLLLQSERRALLFGSALLIHVVTAAACFALARGVGAQLSVVDAGILIPPVVLLTAVPISISGWGVREGAMVACLGLAGVPSEEALSVSLLLGAISVIIGLVGGAIWLASPERGSYSADKAAKAAKEAPGYDGLGKEVSSHP
ncbi:lysylphosphatidylglycerol synthase transmembrane domain-containing protein [Bradyrhizobium symbiodeficiens]|uniref:Lysylphosphatidylglycerol synthase transmembrane domain-containing protein n=1 Tax=Bradyrhizobium symbiodeficiens TaxID=1404367 RepID=A0ABX5W8G7_9BRAD|nr:MULTISPECIES: lysylphosphatidylglycerol synthase transmembrane domain-containing protein [Bradyrhizobium]QDF38732.1 flippase-like domain-containing protein [Bradyrhizobium symbiodeficiens]UPJ56098.1 flippase-like domain-containing protein [Bradyrhizobium sp. 192]